MEYLKLSKLENFDIADLNGHGKFQIPELPAVTSTNFKRFERLIYAKDIKDLYNVCLHTFSYDYQFNSVWSKPDEWTDRLLDVNCVIAPDFSLYRDMPYALQLYNHYRKHWVAGYWLEAGIKVIPNIRWSDKKSYDFCFEGEPKKSIIAIGTTGTQRDCVAHDLFIKGFEETLRRLEPTKILMYGSVPENLNTHGVEIVHIPHHYDQRRLNKKLAECQKQMELTKL